MGSEEIKAMGLKSAGDRLKGDPSGYTILDVDISRADLLARYEGQPSEQTLIRSVKQDRRTRDIVLHVPEFLAFVESCRGGVGEDVHFYRLKPDNEGVEHKLITKGANRTAALRIVNDDRIAAGQAPWALRSVQAPRPSKEDDPTKFAEEQHALSNVRMRMKPSHSAGIAAKFDARGMDHEDIRRYIDGNPSAEEIEALVVLDGLCEEVKDACDAGTVKAIQCAVLAGKSEDAQRAWLARKTAPRPVRAKRPATPRGPSPKRLDAFAAALAAQPAMAQLLGLARGTLPLSEVTDDDVRAAWLASEEAR